MKKKDEKAMALSILCLVNCLASEDRLKRLQWLWYTGYVIIVWGILSCPLRNETMPQNSNFLMKSQVKKKKELL